MRKNNTKLRAYMDDVQPDKCFWVNNGWIIGGMKELPIALENMSNDTFKYHVNGKKNDFGKWVREVIGDTTLARALSKAGNRKNALIAVKKRIKQIGG